MEIVVYVNSCKESMYDKGLELGLEGEILSNFSYCCYEVKLTLQVDVKTGLSKIIKVDDRLVEEI